MTFEQRLAVGEGVTEISVGRASQMHTRNSKECGWIRGRKVASIRKGGCFNQMEQQWQGKRSLWTERSPLLPFQSSAEPTSGQDTMLPSSKRFSFIVTHMNAPIPAVGKKLLAATRQSTIVNSSNLGCTQAEHPQWAVPCWEFLS